MRGKQAALSANRRQREQRVVEEGLRTEIADLRRRLRQAEQRVTHFDTTAAELSRLRREVDEGTFGVLDAARECERQLRSEYESRIETIARLVRKKGGMTDADWIELDRAFGPAALDLYWADERERLNRTFRRNLHNPRHAPAVGSEQTQEAHSSEWRDSLPPASFSTKDDALTR
jgi:hypothetical protein